MASSKLRVDSPSLFEFGSSVSKTMPSIPERGRWARKITYWCGVAVFGIAILSILGWIMESRQLLQFGTHSAPIRLSTGVAFFCMAAIIGALRAEYFRCSFILSLLVFAFSISTLIQYFFGVSFGLDTIFQTASEAANGSFPGRMSLNASSGLAIASIVSASLGSPARHLVRSPAFSLISILIVAIGAAGFFGHIAGVQAAYSWGLTNPMGVGASFGLIFLGVALTALAWDRFFSLSPSIRELWRSITIYSVLGVLIVAFLSAVFAIFPFFAQLQIFAQENVKHVSDVRAASVGESFQAFRTEAKRFSEVINIEVLSPHFRTASRRAELERLLESGQSILGYERRRAGKEVMVSLGVKIPAGLFEESLETSSIVGPVLIGSNQYFFMSTRFSLSGNEYEDLFLFGVDRLEEALAAQSGSIGAYELYLTRRRSPTQESIYRYDARLHRLTRLADKDESRFTTALSQMARGGVDVFRTSSLESQILYLAYAKIPLSAHGVVAAASSKQLYHRLNQQLAEFVSAAIMLVLLGSLGMFFLVRDLVSHAELLQERADLDGQRVRESLEEKEILLKEIHHRVKNNLQVISSLLQLQSRRIQAEPLKRAFEDSQDRVRSIALIHEMLYQSDQMSRVPLKAYIRQLTSQLVSSYGLSALISVEVTGAELELDLDTAIPTGLLLNEIVTNALKHAFQGRSDGKIEISTHLEHDTLVLRVQDNGIGITPHNTDESSTTSLGMRLIEALIAQLEGTLERKDGDGTLYILRIPLADGL